MRRICLVGPYSAHLNPISLHLRRLKPILEGSGLSVTVFDTEGGGGNADGIVSASSRLAMLRTLWSLPPAIIEFHTDRIDPLTGISVALLAGKHQVLVSLHGGTSAGQVGSWSWPQRTALSWTRLVIVHDLTSQDQAKRLTWKGRIVALPEYLPPSESPSLQRQELLDLRAKHKFLIVAAAPEMGIRLGGDVHGAGILVDAVQKLVQDAGCDVAVIFHVSKTAEPASLLDVRRRLAEATLEDRWQLIDGQPDLLPALWPIADAFVRPGAVVLDGRTQRDVMSARVPVVVSDVSDAGPGVLTFHQGDANDLYRVLLELTRTLEEVKVRLDQLPFRGTPDRYVQMYRSLGRERVALTS